MCERESHARTRADTRQPSESEGGRGPSEGRKANRRDVVMAAKIVPTSGRGATSAADAVDDELNGIMDAVAEDLDNWDGGNDLYDEPPPPPPKKLAPPPKPVERLC